MGLTIRHATQSNVADEGVAGEIGPTEWNEGHTIADGEPIVILATGQSNFVQTPAFAWSPEFAGSPLELQPHRRQYRHRLRRAAVDHDQCHGQVRVRGRAAQSDAIGLSDQYGDGVVRQQTISHWLPGTSAPDEVSADHQQRPGGAGGDRRDQDRPVAVVAGRGADRRRLRMYQYPTDWETFHGRLLLETWFPRATPVIIFGLSPTSISGSILPPTS